MVSEDYNPENPIAVFLRAQRKARRLSQQQLAELSGLGYRFINEVERGKTTCQMDKVNALLAFWNCELTVRRKEY